jgi:exopolysaccharide biosynthesis polyprenyl glycosylphosphotransferase
MQDAAGAGYALPTSTSNGMHDASFGAVPLSPDLPAAELSHPAVIRRDTLYRRCLAATDVFAAAAAVVVSVAVLGADSPSPAMLATVPLVVLVGKVIGLYDRDEHLVRKTTLDEAPELFQLSTLLALLIWLTSDLFVQGQLGREQLLALWVVLFLFLILARALTRRVVTVVVPEERCLVLGDPSVADVVQCTFQRSPHINASVVGQLPIAVGRRRGEQPPELGAPEPLTETLERLDVHRVIVAPAGHDSEEMLTTIRLVKGLGVKISVLPRLFEAIGSSAKFDHADGITLLGVQSFGLSNSSWLLKRGLDVLASSVLLVLVAPVLLAIAIGVKLASPGPVLFKQTRVGRGGVRFQMLKFRSMVDGADDRRLELGALNEADGLFKIEQDPRLTRFGRLIRRLSLDELPQLVNVFRGDMSLVGPRPLVPEEARQARGWQLRRLNLPPGMTGTWQILGSARVPFNDMVKLDYLYGANWSVWLDLKILLRTIPYVAARRGM